MIRRGVIPSLRRGAFQLLSSLALLLALVPGCARETAAPAAPQPLVVGFLGALTGDAASFGMSQRNGIEMAVEEINGRGGVWGRPVKVVYEDTRLDQNAAVAAMNKVIDVDGARIVLGDTSSGNTIAIGPIAQRRGVILLSPIASAANVTRSGFDVFRLSPSDAFQARVALRFALENGWSRIAILYTNDDWGGGLARELEADLNATAAGKATVVEMLGVEPQSQDFRPQLTRIREAKPDVVYIPLHPAEAAVALRQARQLRMDTAFLGADSFSEPSVGLNAGPAADGVVYTVPAAAVGARFDAFAVAFRQKFGELPNYNAAAGYDALMVVADAARRSATQDIPGLKKAIAATAGYQGVSGVVSFDAHGDVISKAYDIKKLQAGQPVLVKGQISLTP